MQSQTCSEQLLSISNELKILTKQKKFDIKSISTFGVFRPAQLQSIGFMKIREETFRQLLSKTLKVCNLYIPIMKTLYQIQDMKEQVHSNPNNLLKVSTILQILSQNLFYRHMVKLKVDNMEMVINLVNNRLTELNQRVVIASLIIYISKRLSLQDIGTSLLIFYLQQALLKFKPYGLPLDQNFLHKCIKKLQRVLNVNDLKFFIQTVKQQGEPLSRAEKEDLQFNVKMDTGCSANNYISALNYQYSIGPQHFLYLVALSEKKSMPSSIFVHGLNGKSESQNKKIGIQLFMNKKRLQYASSMVENSEIQIIKNNQQNKVINNDLINNAHNNCPVREKVRGLSLHGSESECIKRLSYQNQVYKQIKLCLRQKVQNPKKKYSSIHVNSQLFSSQNQGSTQTTQQNKVGIKLRSVSCAGKLNSKRNQNLLVNKPENSLIVKKLKRPMSSMLFQSGLNLIQKSTEQNSNFLNNLKYQMNCKQKNYLTQYKKKKQLQIAKNKMRECKKPSKIIQKQQDQKEQTKSYVQRSIFKVLSNHIQQQKYKKHLIQSRKGKQNELSTKNPIFSQINKTFNEHFLHQKSEYYNIFSQLQPDIQRQFHRQNLMIKKSPSSYKKDPQKFHQQQDIKNSSKYSEQVHKHQSPHKIFGQACHKKNIMTQKNQNSVKIAQKFVKLRKPQTYKTAVNKTSFKSCLKTDETTNKQKKLRILDQRNVN